MKKILLALCLLALAAVPALASTVDIQWSTLWGIYDDAAVDLTSTTTGGILDSYSLTWQLIYSVNNTAGAPDLGNSANGYVSGDDTVWGTRTFNQDNGVSIEAGDDTEWDLFVYFVSGDRQYINASWVGDDNGYIYQRVYQGAIQAGTWYFDSTPVALDTDPAGGVQENYIDVTGGGTSGIQPDQQISSVPEPATMGLLGLGALVMAMRRRRS